MLDGVSKEFAAACRAEPVQLVAVGGKTRARSGLGCRCAQPRLIACIPPGCLGVRVSTRDVNGDGKADIITAPASASPARIRVVNAATLQDLDTFFAFDPDYLGGSYVG